MCENAPRPPRSLRNRNSIPERPSAIDGSASKSNEKPKDYGSESESYMEKIEDELSEKEDTEEKVENIIAAANKGAKVQVLNLRSNRFSADETTKKSKEKIREDVGKVKEEFQKVEEVVEETKEELSKLTEKVKEDANQIKEKITHFGLKTFEKILNSPKEFVLKLFFKKKEKPREEKNSQPVIKKIPKIKYADLLAQHIEFLSHDKGTLVDPGDRGVLLEEIFLSNALADVKFCSRYVVELGMPTKGMYAEREIVEIFQNVTPEDLNYFLYYVNKNPEPFKGTKYKFSEAFATWILRKSHEI